MWPSKRGRRRNANASKQNEHQKILTPQSKGVSLLAWFVPYLSIAMGHDAVSDAERGDSSVGASDVRKGSSYGHSILEWHTRTRAQRRIDGVARHTGLSRMIPHSTDKTTNTKRSIKPNRTPTRTMHQDNDQGCGRGSLAGQSTPKYGNSTRYD